MSQDLCKNLKRSERLFGVLLQQGRAIINQKSRPLSEKQTIFKPFTFIHLLRESGARKFSLKNNPVSVRQIRESIDEI